ncbi:hypothetical protein [Paeniglutamicibacter cryotolerans]|uniref:Uncharacterized protein n=1 Tax=Paeniglutamicibacter cryotolerans TaxID=670079 RepID=A0A839QJZ4_9MICC|nr:hypothetical protein [Paeniglutamicibacter cryotolerans]MBB2995913.1 hypothetical protein [Paeniglutamicibacter cryotolerans]
MLNPQLVGIVINSLRAAGITPPELAPIRPFPKIRADTAELPELIVSSEYEDPYADPKVIAVVSKLYIQSIGQLDQTHYLNELRRQAAELESHTKTILEQLQNAFNATANALVADADPIKGVEDPATIDQRTARRDTATSALNVTQGITTLENLIKAWRDLWGAIGSNSYGNNAGMPFTFMNPNAQQWEELRHKPTIWEAVRAGEPLTLADSPEHVGKRYQSMLHNEQVALHALRESKHPSLLPEGGYGSFIV